MISSTVATLECAAQVTTAPIRMQSTGSPVMAPISTRTLGAFSAGASVSSRICSDSSISPRPMATRPRSLMRERGPLRKASRPMMNSTGATSVMLKESTCTISVVPRLAPSMIASAGTSATSPSAANELVIRAVAVLLCKRAVSPRPAAKAEKRSFSAFDSSRRRSGPNARRMPLWTMCRPHSSSATPPIRSSRTMLPMISNSQTKGQANAKGARVKPQCLLGSGSTPVAATGFPPAQPTFNPNSGPGRPVCRRPSHRCETRCPRTPW